MNGQGELKIRFLGTSAAEGVPALFCTCKHCQYARTHGGKEIRGRSSALINDDLLIDFGPDAFRNMTKYHLGYTPLRAVLITHSHADHLSVGEIGYRREGFGTFSQDDVPMTVYGNARVGEKISSVLNPKLLFQEIKPFEPIDIEGYRVTGLEAVHFVKYDSNQFIVHAKGKMVGREEEAMIYFIEKDGVSLLYAHDTDEFTDRTLDYLENRHIDLISLDCNHGSWECEFLGHMGAAGNLRMREKLLANGAADEHTVFVANHFSHNGLIPFEELEGILPGFIVAYDGMTCDVVGE